MPTVASKPTLESTRAVGAVLWDQFARDRLRMAGMSDNLVTEAERTGAAKDEDIGARHDSQIDDSSTSNISHQANACSTPVRNESYLNGHDESADVNSTTTSRQNEAELYQSVTESLQEGDRTVYHSMSNDTHDPLPINTSQAMPVMASYGKELRRIAEEFERTRERQLLKERANKVPLTKINRETFMHLLKELFDGGVTRERIVVLFFFCTDVAVQAASSDQNLVVKFLRWSFSFIVDTVCRVVYELGGWDYELGVWHNVIFRQLPSILISSCAFLGICVLAIQLHKSLRA